MINSSDEEIEALKERYGLDKNKQTILYAPTFFPSSIEKMSKVFPQDFAQYNIIVKPHYLSWERKRYQAQRKYFDTWKTYPNCQVLGVEEYNLIPFILMADIMISDESSAIFEFASLNKPVIINRFLTLRWSYYLNPKKILKRMDKGMNNYKKIGANPSSYKEMIEATHDALKDKSTFEVQRLEMAKDICGLVDGQASMRITKVIKDVCGF
ncbi:MAG: CDP-glycerol glycerophosphotransferase family protein [Sulfurovum sp.]|nr:CDP-glycerol glycerophosphotransferase family protein [Sulfurovum sp.]